MRYAFQLVTNRLGKQLIADLIQMTTIILIHVQAIIEDARRIEEIYPRGKAVGTCFDKEGIDDLRFLPTCGRLRTVRLEVVAFAEPLVGMQDMEIGRPDALCGLRHRKG